MGPSIALDQSPNAHQLFDHVHRGGEGMVQVDGLELTGGCSTRKGLDWRGEASIAVGVAGTNESRRALPPRWLFADGGVAAVTARAAVPTARRALMAKSNQIASSAKPARAVRKGAAAAKKSIKPKPARHGRRAATAPEEKRGGTKQARVITLLGRDTGATLNELIAATGWLPHTTRAALTGLRHKGFVLARDRHSRSTQCHLLRACDGLPVERGADGPAAEEHDLRLSRPVGLGRHIGAYPFCTLSRRA